MSTQHDRWFFGADPDEPTATQDALENIMSASIDELRAYCNAHHDEEDNILFNIAQLRVSAMRKRLRGYIDAAMRDESIAHIYYRNELGRIEEEREWNQRDDHSGVYDF